MQTINFNLVNGYRVKSLCTDDCKIVEKLCEKCSDYYILHDGVLPSIEDVNGIFMVLPPNKSYGDKFVLGIFTFDNKLVGIVDIVRDFPTVGEWMLGLMLIDPDERGRGIGKIVHKVLSEWAINLGAKSFRIGVIQENYKGIKFWSGLGYRKINEVDMEFTAKTHIVNVMRLKFCD
ncbi:GNAT family N-acetyltransferase [Calorimonas adulescens]|uniref:GNAT family N-acetyltransferase n=1 Tax=Calorimonas adulescens TaxID=2606906 RepID=A0A5D8QC53_9THEO|nr:GNAT family N-acetyltransferase [Calorimonas adulescens]TZE82112.1 GNAT family N-acetyltransferase [Calorimonas adulescens]